MKGMNHRGPNLRLHNGGVADSITNFGQRKDALNQSFERFRQEVENSFSSIVLVELAKLSGRQKKRLKWGLRAKMGTLALSLDQLISKT